MTLLQMAVLAAAGFAAGTVNAIAGGGTFLTFAALVFSGNIRRPGQPAAKNAKAWLTRGGIQPDPPIIIRNAGADGAVIGKHKTSDVFHDAVHG